MIKRVRVLKLKKGSECSDSAVKNKQMTRKRHRIVSDTSSDGDVENTDEAKLLQNLYTYLEEALGLHAQNVILQGKVWE